MILGPSALALGWLGLWTIASHGPGLGWISSHIVLLLGIVFLPPAAIGLRRLLPRPIPKWRNWDLPLLYFGAFTIVIQYLVDLSLGLIARDNVEMGVLFGKIFAVRVVRILFYDVGPPCAYLSVMVIAIRHLWAGTRWRAAGLISIGIIVVAAGRAMNSAVLTLLGHLIMLVGFLLAAPPAAIVSLPKSRQDEARN